MDAKYVSTGKSAEHLGDGFEPSIFAYLCFLIICSYMQVS